MLSYPSLLLFICALQKQSCILGERPTVKLPSAVVADQAGTSTQPSGLDADLAVVQKLVTDPAVVQFSGVAADPAIAQHSAFIAEPQGTQPSSFAADLAQLDKLAADPAAPAPSSSTVVPGQASAEAASPSTVALGQAGAQASGLAADPAISMSEPLDSLAPGPGQPMGVMTPTGLAPGLGHGNHGEVLRGLVESLTPRSAPQPSKLAGATPDKGGYQLHTALSSMMDSFSQTENALLYLKNLKLAAEVDDFKKVVEKEQVRVAAVALTDNACASVWAHPVAFGIILGLLLNGPDSVGTLMTLSGLTNRAASFKVGFAWGLGHCLGMIAMCITLCVLGGNQSTQQLHLSTSTWLYCGDYFIGISMVIIAVYFVVYKSFYMVVQRDGGYFAKGCALPETPRASEKAPRQEPREDMPLLQGLGAFTAARFFHSLQAVTSTTTLRVTLHDVQATTLGALQGAFCPTHFAIALLGNVNNRPPPLKLAVFAVVFTIVSAAGCGVIALAWAALTKSVSATSRALPPRTMYVATCAATFALGVCWILANFTGFLHLVNFEEKVIRNFALFL